MALSVPEDMLLVFRAGYEGTRIERFERRTGAKVQVVYNVVIVVAIPPPKHARSRTIFLHVCSYHCISFRVDLSLPFKGLAHTICTSGK